MFMLMQYNTFNLTTLCQTLKCRIKYTNAHSQFVEITICSSSRRKLNHQLWLLPQNKGILVHPIIAHRVQFHIEVENHASEDNAHFNICKAGRNVSKQGSEIGGRYTSTYFRPIQLRGPKLKGCITDLLSFT